MSKIDEMKIFLVGGAVRDKLMGLAPRDLDYVVIESTHEELIRSGLVPVGKSFSIYLDPKTKEEYSLTDDLKQDLERRDLTINALAEKDGKLIDFFHGVSDLEQKVLRHIKDENFFTDPLRVYRVARFAGQFPGFVVHESTLALMDSVVKSPGFPAIDPERIFLELRKALTSSAPWRFFEVIKSVRGESVHFPELEDSDLFLLKKTCLLTENEVIRFSSLFSRSTPEVVLGLGRRLLLPKNWQDGGLLIASQFKKELRSAEDVLGTLYDIDAFRRPSHLVMLTTVFRASGRDSSHFVQGFEAIRSVTYHDVPSSLKGKDISEAIRRKRLEILTRLYST